MIVRRRRVPLPRSFLAFRVSSIAVGLVFVLLTTDTLSTIQAWANTTIQAAASILTLLNNPSTENAGKGK